jgi:hypothetical protein
LVIDTNVLISSFFGGNPKKVIDLWRTGRAVLCLSDEILKEYLRVIARLPIAPETTNKLVAILREKRNIELVASSRHRAVIRENPEDDKFIGCAVEGKADCIVSGDAHLLPAKVYQAIPIYSPKDFLQIIRP